MNRVVLAVACLLAPLVAFGAGGGAPTMSANTDLTNQKSLQRGAAVYVNYCLGCHSIQFMRFNRLAEDLGLDPELAKENLMFTCLLYTSDAADE